MFSHKQSYTQEEIKVQQGIVTEAIKQRNSLDSHSEDYNRGNIAVECAQEILNFMMESVIDSHKK